MAIVDRILSLGNERAVRNAWAVIDRRRVEQAHVEVVVMRVKALV